MAKPRSILLYAIVTENIQQERGDRLQNYMMTWSEFKLCLITGCQLPSGKFKMQRLTDTQANLFCEKKNIS